MVAWIEKLKIFFKDIDDTHDQEKSNETQQKKETKVNKRKIYTFEDLRFIRDNYSDLVYAKLEFSNYYNMYISVTNFTRGDIYSSSELLKRDAPEGYKITITDPKNVQNNTCLNKDGKSILVYSKQSVTEIMKQIQQLDENGQLPKVDVKVKIEARKNHIKKARILRKELEKRNKEENISGVIIADNIAEKIISGEEKRPITPDVVSEYRKNALINKR